MASQFARDYAIGFERRMKKLYRSDGLGAGTDLPLVCIFMLKYMLSRLLGMSFYSEKDKTALAVSNQYQR